MVKLPQEICVSIPLLVVAAGDKSAECSKVMERFCEAPFIVECKNVPTLTDLCISSDLDTPSSLRIHPILCKTVTDLIQVSDILSVEKYHFFFKCFATLVFIDYSSNNDISNIQEQFLTIPGVHQDTCSFVIYKASELLLDHHSETTCLCFESHSDSVVISCIHDFLSKTAATSACRLLEFGLTQDVKDSPFQTVKVRADFTAVGCDIHSAIEILHAAPHGSDCKDLEWNGTYYETLGMLEHREPGITKACKMMPSGGMIHCFSGMHGMKSDDLPVEIVCYLYGAGYYDKAGCYSKCVECGMRIIILGFQQMLYPVMNYIIDHAKHANLSREAWNLINLIQRNGMKRHAVLLAAQLSNAFDDVEVCSEMRIYSLNLLLRLTDASGFMQLRDLGIPMFLSLLKSSFKLPREIMGKFLAKIVSTIGPKLDTDQQQELFSQLSEVNVLYINLPITVKRAEVKRLPYDFVKMERGPNAQKKDVFIYSYLPRDKKSSTDPISLPVSQLITVMVELHNPFAVPLCCEQTRLVVSESSVDCKAKPETLEPLGTTTIHCYILPSEMTSFAVTGLEMCFYGVKQTIELEHPIKIDIVNNVPRYHLRTDLPLSSNMTLYDGEYHEFFLWITNSGSSPISDLKIDFHHPDVTHVLDAPKLPLLPSCELAVKCCMVANKKEDVITIKVTCSCENSEYCCTQSLHQRISISDSLTVQRIFLIKASSPDSVKENDNSDQICVGYQVENLSDCTFQYKALVSDTRVKGLLGGNESMLIIAHYPLTELKSDGSDADKSRVVALTKFMEEKLGTAIKPEQRLKVAKCVSIMQKLEAKWKFNWAISSLRTGTLTTRTTIIDDDLYDIIESQQVRANISWLLDGQEAVSVRRNELYELVADYGNTLIRSCELTFVTDCARDHSLLWEGELCRTDEAGTSQFRFILCFSFPGSFVLKIAHLTSAGVSGYTPVSVRVAD